MTRKEDGSSKSRARPKSPLKVESLEDEIAVRQAVRERYTKLATAEERCCAPMTMSSCGCGAAYPQAEILSLPAEAVSVSAGCGNPAAIAGLKPGMVVVDLGSGGGIDAFLAAKKVGAEGRVYGIDATPEMVYRARRTAAEYGFANVEFRLGEIEHIPLESGIADVVMSNCVINLSPDKEQVFREAFRVLKPGGKLAVSDIVLLRDLPEDIRNDLRGWSECVSGAVSEQEYLRAIERAGFERVKVEDRAVFAHEQLVAFLESAGHRGEQRLAEVDLGGMVASCRVTASKPRG